MQHNLYGLDIDERAGQLAYFALMMKARGYNRRFFRQENIPQPMVYAANGDAELSEFGSLVKVDELGDKPQPPDELTVANVGAELKYERSLLGWQYRSLLAQKYDVVVTNPPYMNPAPKQADWVKKNYPNSKSDLCVVFIERNFDLLNQNGLLSMITMHSWMFLSSYEKFCESLIASKDIIKMAHLGARAFEEIGGEVVQTTAFVLRTSNLEDYIGSYSRLVDVTGQQAKEHLFIEGSHIYDVKKLSFKQIPESITAYWLSESMLNTFEKGNVLNSIFRTISGSSTGDNSKFLKSWFEVSKDKIGFNLTSSYNGLIYKWIPCIKGGGFRRWYGNLEHIINWENDGVDLKAFATMKNSGKHWLRFLKSLDCFYKEGVTWSKITSGVFSARFLPEGFILESAANAIMTTNSDTFSMLAFANTHIAQKTLGVFNPTINIQSGNVANLPVLDLGNNASIVNNLAKECVEICKSDWDSFETSWDFQCHPLIPTMEEQNE